MQVFDYCINIYGTDLATDEMTGDTNPCVNLRHFLRYQWEKDS